jgi:hypothetical protein
VKQQNKTTLSGHDKRKYIRVWEHTGRYQQQAGSTGRDSVVSKQWGLWFRDSMLACREERITLKLKLKKEKKPQSKSTSKKYKSIYKCIQMLRGTEGK